MFGDRITDENIDVVSGDFVSRDGTRLAYYVLGSGRPLVLIHGFMSNAYVNWIKYGHAELLTRHGYQLVLPDLRGHGAGSAPHDASRYPADALVDDCLDLVAHLSLVDYDLGGYSLGARTAVRAVVRGARPSRLVVAGMGLEGLLNAVERGARFRTLFANLGGFEHGSAMWAAEAFLRSTGGDPLALCHIPETFVDTPLAALASITASTLVIAGRDDQENGAAEALAAVLPNATHLAVPGNHMSTVTKRELSEVVIRYLGPDSEAVGGSAERSCS